MLTREQSRQFDQFAIETLGIPGLVLMENAGRGCVEALLADQHPVPGRPPVASILCGPGNNGGDGFVIARHLWNAGWNVKVVLICNSANQYSGDAAVMLRGLYRLPISIVEFDASTDEQQQREVLHHVGRRSCDWIVDAMLGTGATGHLRHPLDQVVTLCNQSDARKLAVDIPTGLDCDSGTPSPITFRADLTCCFVDRKQGFDNPAAAPYLGQVAVVGIGIDSRIWPSP